ncbi:glycoside hydrolase family 76 protein [Streptantibioticus silvisoli]|nr:glycoside hydrolase family 76 protein [Streptantibioticus silvisoli]
MRRTWWWMVLLVAAMMAAGQPVASAAVRPADSTTVCALYCDTRDPSLAQQETFPVPNVTENGRVIELHVSDADGMAWASIDDGQPNDSVWIDRSWDGGSTWDGLLGQASIPSTWTGTRTLMYNLYDPVDHRRSVLRACGDAAGTVCTQWTYAKVCATYCDGVADSTGTGDTQPVPAATLSGRTISLHTDSGGMAWATIAGGAAGDEVWMDRSWDEGTDWPDGSSEGRVSVPSGATGTATVKINTDDTLGRLYGGAVRACGRAVTGENGSCTAWARPATSHDAAAVDALMYDYDPNTAYWDSSWWNSAVALSTVIDYMRQTGDTKYEWIVDHTFEVNKVAFPAGARSSDPIQGDFISQATDDTEWWALAWIDAYDLTHDQKYLNEAVTIANHVNGLWDSSTCGGGVWWNASKTYKNAVTNALYIRMTAELHNRISGDTAWLGRATTAWSWFQSSGLINSSGLVNDGLTSGCANNGQTVWSYNQGLAIGAGVEIYRATGDAGALSEARTLASAALSSSALVTGGLLTESCDTLTTDCDDNAKQFKGVFMRYLQDLDSVTGNAYSAFATTQANSIWNADRDSLNRLGVRWSGQGSSAHPNTADWRTQASALSALLAAG